MRILSFSKRWQKLSNSEFTTFRFSRRDKDWYLGEIVQVYYKNRSPQRERLGIAKIVAKESKDGEYFITDQEAKEDGFESKVEMWRWLIKSHSPEQLIRTLNKLTLRWHRER